ncbi:MAG: sugar phosphate isomerase/epimerase family protein [Lawsonibacter sp.]|nr:sugar phosphate isomerase/epimerase family protein [Lawsonibacter sp.]
MNKLNWKQLSGMNCHYAHYPFSYFLDAAVENGLKNVEIWAASPHVHVEDATAQIIRETRQALDSRELNLVCYTPETVVYPINIAAPEEYIRTRSLNFLKRGVEITAELGCGRMLLTSGWGYLNQSREESRKRAIASIAEMARKAEREGVTLALEHLSPISSNLINTAADLRQALDEVDSPHLKAMLDTCQVGLVHEHVRDYLDLLGSDLIHVHLVDGTPGGHLAFGDGNLPLKEFVDTLGESGYSGYLSMEIADRRYFMDPKRADRQSIEAFCQWIR